MFGNRARSDASNEGTQMQRKREGRGLGPLSSTQLTVIIVTVVIVVAFPFAAGAVGSAVNIVDATSGNQAQVASGQLKVDTGISHPFGIVPVAPVAPIIYPTSDIIHTDDGFGDEFVGAGDCSTGTCSTVLKPPAGKGAVVTSIHIDTFRATVTGSGEFLEFLRSTDGSCTIGSLNRVVEYFNPGGIGETQLQYDMPGGLSVPAGTALCMFNDDTTNLGFYVSARGYKVASNAVPANAPAAGAPKGAALLKPKQ
jgi:hypothetical protein